MQLPRVLARFNRHVTNPIQRRWAGVLPGYGIIEHVGRKSGRTYRTPLNVFRAGPGFAIWIGYGVQSDWVRNLQAAGGGQLVHRRVRYTLSAPRILTGDEGRAKLPLPYRIISKLTGNNTVLLLDTVRQ